MAWYDEAVFYHIYPLGLTGAPKQNEYGEPEHRLNTIIPWIDHIKRMNMNALYIGPLFESVGHGYETTDYKKLDSRLGTNDDLKAFVKKCHEKGIKVIFDGVFNHTGRDFFAFKDIKEKREGSQYRDWYCNVNFYGNNEYNDGFSYDNWGGYNLLVKLNQRNPAVRDYICDVIRFWVSEFDIDGIRLDAADVLDFDFMKALRRTAEEVKADFWLMGEVIHGDYSRWANNDTLHSVTDYALHKALYSGHNDHNYFEIAHTVKRTNDIVPANIRLYNFVDNHDVERIGTKLNNKAHLGLAYILEYCLPGIPSVYYGSEFGIEGKKEKYSDDSLRPHIDLKDHETDYSDNPCTRLLVRLGEIYRENRELVWGDYRQLLLTNRQFAFARGSIIVALNNDDNEADINVEASSGSYTGLLSGKTFNSANGRL
nr:alpha-amylase [Lachnospiraceae bacterium]